MHGVKERRSRLLENASRAGFNAVAAFEPENVFYLTGFWGEAIAVCTDSGTKLIAPKLEFSRAQQSSIDCDVVPTERGSEFLSTFTSHIKGKKACADVQDYGTVEQVRRAALGAMQGRADIPEIRTVLESVVENEPALAEELVRAGLVVFYDTPGGFVVWVSGFVKHQRPHPKEAPSVIPAWPEGK